MRKIDIIGKRFTRLMVISKVGSDKWGHLRYSCLCDCGKQKVLTTSMLTSGNTKSCGCLFRDMDRSGSNGPNYDHGENIRGEKHPNYKHGLCGTKTYETYTATVRRRRKRSQIASNFDLKKVLAIYKTCHIMNREGNEVYVVDHIQPLSKGGLNGQDNLQILPYTLNAEKSNKWPLTEEQKCRYTGLTISLLGGIPI